MPTNSKKSARRETESAQSVIAQSEDGSIQITFTLPWKVVEKSKGEAISELGKDIEVAGFRKGNAPEEKLLEKISQNTLIERTLSKILPGLFAEAIKKHKINPAIYPKFEVLKKTEGEDWQVRAQTAEIPEINLGDYKKIIEGETRAKGIWTPSSANLPAGKAGATEGKPDNKEGKEVSRQEKEQEVIKLLIKNISFDLPKILVEEEVNSRLSRLLERIEKLGINLDSYLASIGKTAIQLRKEYEGQARNALKLDLILAQISKKEGLKVEKSEVDAAIKAGSSDPKLAEKLDTPEQRRLIESVLLRRAALDSLVSLV
ncbi:MAG: trigger factor [Patescibacteria group bacterium]